MIELPEIAGNVAQEGSTLPTTEDRPGRHDGRLGQRRKSRAELGQLFGESPIQRVRPILGRETPAVAFLRAVTFGHEDLALATVDPEDAHAVVRRAERGVTVDLDDVEFEPGVVGFEEFAEAGEARRIVQLRDPHLSHGSILALNPAEFHVPYILS